MIPIPHPTGKGPVGGYLERRGISPERCIWRKDNRDHPRIVVLGNDLHEIVLTPRNWSRVKRGGKLMLRSRGFSEEGPQWEYWTFSGGLNGRLLVEDDGVGFDDKTARCDDRGRVDCLGPLDANRRTI